MENAFEGALLTRAQSTENYEEDIPSFCPLRLVHPEAPANKNEVIVHRGDLITLEIHFSEEDPGLYVSINSSGIPTREDETRGEKIHRKGLSLEMELWDITFPHRFPFKAFCALHEDPSLMSETESCRCLVCFHGRYFPIRGQRAEICFEFPIIGNGHNSLQKYEIVLLLSQVGLSSSVIGRCTLSYTFTVLPSTQQPRTEATLLVPVHVQRLLSSHTLSETGSTLHDSFGHILAEVLGLNCHCIPLHSALSSDIYLKMIYHLPATHRQLLMVTFEEEFEHCCTLVERDSEEMKSLKEQYDIANLIATLHEPIWYLPPELLGEIFRVSVEKFSVTSSTLQGVCHRWRAVVAGLWGKLQVGTWTETQRVTAVLDKTPLSMDVVIDTAEDEARSTLAVEPYAALALAWTSAPKWSSLTIHSFPSRATMRDNNVIFDPSVPFDHLESVSVESGCESSDVVNEIMTAITSTENPKLTSLILAATTVFRQLDQSVWVCIYPQLTSLHLNDVKAAEPVDLRYFARLERLRLSGVVLQDLSHHECLPFLETLRELWLQRVSIRWMDRRIFKRLESCTLLKPVDPRSIGHTSMIRLPVCTSITLHSRVASILAAFNARVANKIEIDCNEWKDARASYELGRIWNRRNQGMLRPKVLSLNIRCSDKALLEALRQLSSLQELTLTLPLPTTLGASFFKALSGMPVKPFTGSTREEWIRWSNDEAEWRVGVCPFLIKLELRYERWLRGSHMDVASPLFIAVAWSRGKLRPPLQKFEVKLEGSEPLQLSGVTHQDSTFMSLWQQAQAIPQTSAQKDVLYTSSLTAVINQSIGFVDGGSALPFDWLGTQYYDSFFCHLRVLHHHPSELPTHPCDILPSFKRLEELYITNFYFTPCPHTASPSLCQTLRILHIRDAPLDWMDQRRFERVTECKIAMNNAEHINRLSKVEMPVCTRMEFAGPNSPNDLQRFDFPNRDPLLELLREERLRANKVAVQNTTLIAPSPPSQKPRMPEKLGGTYVELEGNAADKKAKGTFSWLRKLWGARNVNKQK